MKTIGMVYYKDCKDCKPEKVVEMVKMPSGNIVVRIEGGESLWFDKNGQHPKSYLELEKNKLSPTSKN